MNNFTISLVSACKVTTNYPTMQLFEIKSWPFCTEGYALCKKIDL